MSKELDNVVHATHAEPPMKAQVISAVHDYHSRLSDPASRMMGTFSYLPAMTPDQIRKQIEWIVKNGWNPAIEHTEPQHAMSNYWYMWKLPMFGETDVDVVIAEAEACHKANPGNHVRLLGYDNFKQSQGANMVIYRGKAV
ncbi:MAG: ribulose bisphosphate carboxylase small subunit [Rhodocyclaceae bacterium]|nr:ribulose bisphosphate carboxylase small subunit [Rhodocyclaceae bacterium]